MEIPVQKNFFRGRAVTRGAGNGVKTAGPYPITLVTAYFDLGCKQKKYAGNPYPGWIGNFLPFVQWPLVVFCDEQSLDMLKEMRGDKPAVWHVMSLEEFLCTKYWNLLKNLETDAGFAAEYGLVWHEKHNFLRRALSENPFDSEIFFWCDIGMFRFRQDTSLWRLPLKYFRLYEDVEWPNLRVCRALPQDKVILARTFYLGTPHFWGGFFGGAMEPTRRWCDAYYQRLEERAEKGAFTCSEEWVMQSLFRRQPELAHVLPHDIDPWPRLVGLFIRLLRGKYATNFKWYFLNGRRFPWKYFWRRIFSRAGR